MTYRHPNPWLLALAAFVAAVAVASCGEAPKEEESFEQRARAKIEAFQADLQAELRAALEAGGPVGAVEACRERAPKLTAEASAGDLRIRRIGVRVRNHETNEPTDAEMEILDEFTALPVERRGEAYSIVENDAGRAFYAPIWLGNPICLGCHGDPAEMDGKVREAITRLYPNDKATGFALGDLRGAFVVETAP